MHSFICHNFLLTSCWCHSWRINILSILYKVIVLVLKRNNILFILHEGELITSQNFINDISISSLSSLMNSNGTSISHHKSMFFEQYELLVAEFRHLQNPFPGTGLHCSYRIIWLSTSQPRVHRHRFSWFWGQMVSSTECMHLSSDGQSLCTAQPPG